MVCDACDNSEVNPQQYCVSVKEFLTLIILLVHHVKEPQVIQRIPNTSLDRLPLHQTLVQFLKLAGICVLERRQYFSCDSLATFVEFVNFDLDRQTFNVAGTLG
jgi:hypothetical protein